jgi:hypothetical protein
MDGIVPAVRATCPTTVALTTIARLKLCVKIMQIMQPELVLPLYAIQTRPSRLTRGVLFRLSLYRGVALPSGLPNFANALRSITRNFQTAHSCA